jgi:hypothetical protein
MGTMKKLIVILLFFVSIAGANDTELILKEIKLLREDMNKRFEQVDKRFEQVDKRFEQVDKQIGFLQDVVLAMLVAIFASPFVIEYLARRREEVDRKTIEDFRRVIVVLRELASRDENVSRALKIAGIE